jgi:hypothetical protein
MTTRIDTTMQDAAAHYLRKLHDGDFESAFHGIIELDQAILQLLIPAYHAEKSRHIRSDLLRIIWEFRTPLALPLLNAALRDRSDNLWVKALDGFVTLASAEAAQSLKCILDEESTARNPDDDYIERVREALEQTEEALALKTTSLESSKQ